MLLFYLFIYLLFYFLLLIFLAKYVWLCSHKLCVCTYVFSFLNDSEAETSGNFASGTSTPPDFLHPVACSSCKVAWDPSSLYQQRRDPWRIWLCNHVRHHSLGENQVVESTPFSWGYVGWMELGLFPKRTGIQYWPRSWLLSGVEVKLPKDRPV